MEYIELDSKHTLKDKLYNITQNEQLRSKYWNHNFRTAFEYNFNDKNNINVIYTGSYTPDQYNNSLTTGHFSPCSNCTRCDLSLFSPKEK